jgi:anti-sigma B factor antagonist
MEACPRCLGRIGVHTPMFESPLPYRRLTRGKEGAGRAPAASPGSGRLEVDRRAREGTHLVVASGELDLATAPELAGELRAAVAEGQGNVVVDLCAVSLMDSSGLTILLNAFRRLTHQARGLNVACRPGPIRRVFEAAGLDRTLPLFDDRAQALAAARGPAGGDRG